MHPLMPLPMELQLHQYQQMLLRQHQIAVQRHLPEQASNGSGWCSLLPSGGPPLPQEVKVKLENQKLWQQFHAETTEMIITKLGRRMFPSIQLKVAGLERRARYYILLEVAPASLRRHKYVGSAAGVDEAGPNVGKSRGWTSAGPAESQLSRNRRIYVHPESPATGANWMQHTISFSKLKLTNNAEHRNNVVLTSMHKYVPQVWIIRCDNLANLNDLSSYPASSFVFDETEFIAVTVYQNENITKLKIDNNPFAKGFRETGQSRCKRKFHRSEADDKSSRTDDEEAVSSSDSESNRTSLNLEAPAQRRKTSSETGSLDESSVSSCGGVSPPLPISQNSPSTVESDAQPRLHRPWTDSPPPPASTSASSSSSNSLLPTSTTSSSPVAHDTTMSGYYFPMLQSPFTIQPEFARFPRFPPIGHFAKYH